MGGRRQAGVGTDFAGGAGKHPPQSAPERYGGSCQD